MKGHHNEVKRSQAQGCQSGFTTVENSLGGRGSRFEIWVRGIKRHVVF